MNTAGHYDVNRVPLSGGREGDIRWLTCVHCQFRVDVRALHRRGDKSGAGRYCRARNRMVKHLHADHRRVMLSAEAAANEAGMATFLERAQELHAQVADLASTLPPYKP